MDKETFEKETFYRDLLKKETQRDLIGDGIFDKHLQAQGKLNYVRGKRPKVDCILCSINENNPQVKSYKFYEDDLVFICLNLYPYNPAHLMIVPKRHVEKFEDLTQEERIRIFDLIIKSQKMIKDLFHPTGFNVGYNQGENSGASIKHIHLHVVPRYKGELGFIDIIGKTRVVVQDVESVFKSIKKVVDEYFIEKGL